MLASYAVIGSTVVAVIAILTVALTRSPILQPQFFAPTETLNINAPTKTPIPSVTPAPTPTLLTPTPTSTDTPLPSPTRTRVRFIPTRTPTISMPTITRTTKQGGDFFSMIVDVTYAGLNTNTHYNIVGYASDINPGCSSGWNYCQANGHTELQPSSSNGFVEFQIDLSYIYCNPPYYSPRWSNLVTITLYGPDLAPGTSITTATFSIAHNWCSAWPTSPPP